MLTTYGAAFLALRLLAIWFLFEGLWSFTGDVVFRFDDPYWLSWRLLPHLAPVAIAIILWKNAPGFATRTDVALLRAGVDEPDRDAALRQDRGLRTIVEAAIGILGLWFVLRSGQGALFGLAEYASYPSQDVPLFDSPISLGGSGDMYEQFRRQALLRALSALGALLLGLIVLSARRPLARWLVGAAPITPFGDADDDEDDWADEDTVDESKT